MKVNSVLYLDWLKSLPRNDEDYKAAVCPACGTVGLSFQYFSSSQNAKTGWKLVWSEACEQGISLSRVGIPEGASVLFDETEIAEFNKSHQNIRIIS